jgi:hypothetical protein
MSRLAHTKANMPEDASVNPASMGQGSTTSVTEPAPWPKQPEHQTTTQHTRSKQMTSLDLTHYQGRSCSNGCRRR